jgi:uncharacterized protein
MKTRLIALLSGLVFGVGLIIAGMTNPAKIIGFLNIFGEWDPSLTLVMGGAIAFTLPTFYLLKKRQKTFFQLPFLWSLTEAVDKRLLIGSALFGVGWGLAGFCPGPGIITLTTGQTEPLLFVVSMVVGMTIYYFFDKASAK